MPLPNHQALLVEYRAIGFAWCLAIAACGRPDASTIPVTQTKRPEFVAPGPQQNQTTQPNPSFDFNQAAASPSPTPTVSVPGSGGNDFGSFGGVSGSGSLNGGGGITSAIPELLKCLSGQCNPLSIGSSLAGPFLQGFGGGTLGGGLGGSFISGGGADNIGKLIGSIPQGAFGGCQ